MNRSPSFRLGPVRAGVRACCLPLGVLGGAFASVASAGPAIGVGVDTTALVEAVTVEGARAHQQAFQEFADAADGTREASGDGYIDSVLYVSKLMTDADYEVDVQIFPFLYFEDTTPPELQQLSPEAVTYLADELEGFATMTYSGAGDVTAEATGVDVQIPPAADANSSTSGCEAEDFATFPAGNIALVQRGNCSFFDKASNAQEAGAVGVVIFNEGQEGRTDAFGGTLGETGIEIPVVGANYAVGEALAAGGVQVRLAVDAITESRISANVIADSRVGDEDRTLVVGAHLDSVIEGPGIQDNGSGSAGILEVALQLAALAEAGEVDIDNRVRFAWWGAEELGLLGSRYYVANLEDDELDEIALNLNFDMVGSPNFARFIYDGDGSNSEPAGPEGSAFIEWLLRDWFDGESLASESTPFSGRSDYGPFIAVGIPAGGLFTGAEDIKTEEQVALYGGTAGVAYDECYHLACDDFDNISLEGYDQMLDAMAYSVGVFAKSGLPEPQAAKRAARAGDGVATDYRADLLVR